MELLSLLAILLAAFYLLALGTTALLRPERATRFLGGFAQSLPAHAAELAARVVVGLAMIERAPQMKATRAIAVLGWLLVSTSLVLAVIPWRLHQRFANRAVPLATKHLPLIGVSSLVGGALLLAALL